MLISVRVFTRFQNLNEHFTAFVTAAVLFGLNIRNKNYIL